MVAVEYSSSTAVATASAIETLYCIPTQPPLWPKFWPPQREGAGRGLALCWEPGHSLADLLLPPPPPKTERVSDRKPPFLAPITRFAPSLRTGSRQARSLASRKGGGRWKARVLGPNTRMVTQQVLLLFPPSADSLQMREQVDSPSLVTTPPLESNGLR